MIKNWSFCPWIFRQKNSGINFRVAKIYPNFGPLGPKFQPSADQAGEAGQADGPILTRKGQNGPNFRLWRKLVIQNFRQKILKMKNFRKKIFQIWKILQKFFKKFWKILIFQNLIKIFALAKIFHKIRVSEFCPIFRASEKSPPLSAF